MIRAVFGLLLALAAASAAGAQPAKPLFASDSMLRLTIKGPISEIARAGGRARQPRNAVLSVAGSATDSLPIQLSPRGLTRLKRDVCQFPPLRVRFATAPGPGSLFAGQRQLKLVTHCQGQSSFQKYVLLEYAAYRLYNQLTPASFRARLATIDYVDDDNRPVTTRLGFFIEEIEDSAARNGMRRAAAGDRVALGRLSASDSARVSLFNYMIGNQDFSIRAGPPGEGCCHNSRLIGPTAAGGLIPVPYDFDYAGLVNAPYAVPPNGEGSVLERRYQGFCAHNAHALAIAPLFRSQRGPLLGVLGQVPLDESTRRRAAAYLDGFFAEIADDRRMARFLGTCLR